MLAVKLRGQVTGDGQLIVELPEDLEPGPVEVIVLQEPKAAGRPRRTAAAGHPAFGMWADREEARDPVAFAAELRRRIEHGADRRE